tara:strand:- start:444 stop:653 length:210 start_codon:yes stop_codon:yes gene_type:complete
MKNLTREPWPLRTNFVSWYSMVLGASAAFIEEIEKIPNIIRKKESSCDEFITIRISLNLYKVEYILLSI